MGHMVIHGLFGKLLHAAINSGIHFQAVGREIIGFSIPFPVLVAPSVQWVCLPSDAVIDILILVPAGIARLVIPVRSLGHHIETQELPEIGGRAILVVYAMEIQLQRFHPFLVILRLGKISHFQHLGQHHVTPLAGTLRIAHGVEKGRILAKSHQRGALADIELRRLLVEISIGSRLDAIGTVQEVKIVEIKGDNLLLRVIAFQLDGDDPLYGFLHQSLQGAMGFLAIELLGKLLGDGGASSRLNLPQDAALDDSTTQSPKVYARVLVESLVFGSHQSVDHVRRNLLVRHHHAVFLVQVPRTQHFSVGTVYLCGIAVDGVLQVFQLGQVTYPAIPNGDKASRGSQDKNRQHCPQEENKFTSHRKVSLL